MLHYALLECKIFGLKIWKCKIFDKYHVWLGLISLRPSNQGPVCMFVCLFSFLWPHSFAQSVVGRTLQYEATGPSWSKINSHCNVDDDDDDDDEEEDEYDVWNVILTDNSNWNFPLARKNETFLLSTWARMLYTFTSSVLLGALSFNSKCCVFCVMEVFIVWIVIAELTMSNKITT